MKRGIRRLLIGIAKLAVIAVVAMLVVIAFNTWQLKSRQLPVPPVDSAEPLPGYAERLSQAIQIETISTRGSSQSSTAAFLEMHAFLEQAFPRVHETLQREVHGEYSLLYRWPGRDTAAEPILLMAHLDVVPVDPATLADWQQPPFSGRIADGHVWGRGTLDVKCGALGLLEAVELLHSAEPDFRPAGDIYLALGHDEEIGGRAGNAVIAAALKERGVRLRLVLDEGGAITEGIVPGIERPVAVVGIAEKGMATVKLAVAGPEGHSSMPPPHTAVGRLATAIHRLEAQQMPARIDGATGAMLDYLGPEMPLMNKAAIANRWLLGWLIERQFSAAPATAASIRTTTAATVIEGGVAENVLPPRAAASINFRILPGDSTDTVLRHVKATIANAEIEVSLERHASNPSAVSNPAAPEFALLLRTIRQVFPEAVVTPNLTLGGTDARHYEPLCDNIYRFLPVPMTAADLPRIHGTNERIAVGDYARLIGFYVQLIRNAANASP